MTLTKFPTNGTCHSCERPATITTPSRWFTGQVIGWCDVHGPRDAGACLAAVTLSVALLAGAAAVLTPIAFGDNQPAPRPTVTVTTTVTDTSTRLSRGSRSSSRPAAGVGKPATSVGTKTPTSTWSPTATPSVEARGSAQPASTAGRRGGGPSAAQWHALALCESSDRPGAISPNGLYFGLYQFDLQTWRGVGGHGLPSNASRAEQLKRARILHADRGTKPWPVCGVNLR